MTNQSSPESTQQQEQRQTTVRTVVTSKVVNPQQHQSDDKRTSHQNRHYLCPLCPPPSPLLPSLPRNHFGSHLAFDWQPAVPRCYRCRSRLFLLSSPGTFVIWLGKLEPAGGAPCDRANVRVGVAIRQVSGPGSASIEVNRS